MKWVWYIAVLLALGRVYIGVAFEPEPIQWMDAFKDVAHFFMGFLLALAIASVGERRKSCWFLFWGLTTLETVVAILSRL